MPSADVVLGADPMEGLSAVELGVALGNLDFAAVCREEKAGRLFSVVRGRAGRREYPAFQAWSGIAGTPLCQVLDQLGEITPSDAYGFFAGTTEILDGLTPIEVLTGKLVVARCLDEDAHELQACRRECRLEAVLNYAQTLVALRAA